MFIYLFNVLSIPLYKVMVGGIKTRRDKERVVLAIVFIQMTFIAGMRGISVGVDTRTYQWIYYAAKTLHWKELPSYYMDTGFMFVNKILVSLGAGYRVALFVYATFIYWAVYRFCDRYSTHKLLSLFLFVTMGYYASSMNIVRQFIALGFVLLSYGRLLEKRSMISVISPCVVAALFHDSSIVCLLIVLVYKVITSPRVQKMTKHLKRLVYCSAIVFGSMTTKILMTMGFDMSYMEEGAAYNYNLFSIGFMLKVVVVILGIYAARKALISNPERKVFIDFLNFLNVLSVLMNILSSQYNMFTRLNIYFSFAMIVSIPEFVDYTNIRNKRMVRSAMIAAFLVMFFFDLKGNNGGIVPYNTVMTLISE